MRHSAEHPFAHIALTEGTGRDTTSPLPNATSNEAASGAQSYYFADILPKSTKTRSRRLSQRTAIPLFRRPYVAAAPQLLDPVFLITAFTGLYSQPFGFLCGPSVEGYSAYRSAELASYCRCIGRMPGCRNVPFEQLSTTITGVLTHCAHLAFLSRQVLSVAHGKRSKRYQ